MKIKLRLTLLLILTTGFQIVLQAQQQSALQGKVTTADGQPADGITVTLTNTKKTTATNKQGEYKITGIKPGSYTIRVTAVGLKPVDKTITINEGEIIVTDFVLTENHSELQEVVIAAGKNKPAASSETVAKMPLSRLENPQMYTTLGKDLIEEQVTTDFGSLIKNTPGVYKIQGNRGINTDGAAVYSIRGFRTEVSMIDGMPGQTNGEMDPANVERVEVLKGPSATLFGNVVTSLGGAVNIVTKKPIDTFGGQVAYTMGSYNLNRVTADIYGPANKAGNVLFRLNAAYQNQQSFQDAGFRKSLLLAPALEFRASDKLKINLNAEFYNAEMTSPSTIFLNRTRPFIYDSPDKMGFNWKRSYTTNDITMKMPTTNVRAVATYKITNNWTSQTIVSNNTRKSDGYYQYQFVRMAKSDDTLERNFSLYNTINSTLGVQQNFTGTFTTGAIKHRLLVGLDYVRFTMNNDISNTGLDTINGTYFDDRNYAKISRAIVDQKILAGKSGAVHNHTITEVYSAYASDVINITDNLLAMLSLRVDGFDSKGTRNHIADTIAAFTSYHQTSVSPKLGLVYQVVKNKVSVFANYMNGFINVAPVSQPTNEVSGVFKPQQANQVEGGVKATLFNDKLNFTASYYDIRLTNVTRPGSYTSERDGKTYNVTVQDGSQTSKGFELDVQATPITGLNILAGYGYNDSKFTKSTAALEGRRPPAAGPRNLFTSWFTYTLPKGKLKGFGLGAGGNYVDEHMTSNALATGVFTLPSYTLLNGTIFYEARSYRLAVKVDNATNETYFVGQGTLTPQMPRSISANVTIKF
ncbi:TonB-dependent siderophore receptor [Niastella sp. OAS944]|uniref:TonB-dependent siderophore receptor n=1 Tax=Niastella sp. OAS944 TaxID=2664089 RepID=UPI00347B0FF8|nr:iron complex outermembrane receptor protein [Chitinophagaceae bacterium OAS944]